DAQNLPATLVVRDTNYDFAIEPTRPSECLIDGVDAVCGADHDDVLPRFEAVHQCEELRNDTPFHLAGRLLSFGRDGINLIDKDDGGGVRLRLVEDLAQAFLRLAVEAAHDFRPGDVEEPGFALARNGASQKRLTGTRRPVQKDSLWRIDPQPLKEHRVLQRQLDHLVNLLDSVPEPAYVVVRNVGRPGLVRLHVLGQQLDFGILHDLHDTARSRRHHQQANLLQTERALLVKTTEELLRKQVLIHVLRPSVHRGRHHVARYHGASEQRP